MQIASLILTFFTTLSIGTVFGQNFLPATGNLTQYVGGGGPGGYGAFILSPQVGYGVLSPVALVGVVGYMGAGRLDIIMSNWFGASIKSPNLLNKPENQYDWVIGAGICNKNGVNCDTRRKLGLNVADLVKEELEGQGILSTFMMKGQYKMHDGEDYSNPSKARFGKMSKSFISTETFNRLKQYETLSSLSAPAPRSAGKAYIENSGGTTICNVCGIEGDILVENGETCVVREACDASDNLPDVDGGLELPRVSIMSFDLDALCKSEGDQTTCLDEKTIKSGMLDTFGSTARISVVEGSNYDLEDLYDPIDRKNLMDEEKRRLQTLNLAEFGNTEQCTLQNSYMVSIVFMDDEEFKLAKKEMGSDTIEDDMATWLSADYDNLCGIKVTPKFAYHIPAPNDPSFNRAVRPLEVSMSIPTIQIASEENGHEDILVRGETYRVVMDDFKTGETVTVHLVWVKEDESEEAVRPLKTIQNFNSNEGPMEFDWTVGDLQPVGSYYFEVTIKDIPVSYSSAFEIMA